MPLKKLDRHELQTITGSTLGHYNGRAAAFWEGTRDHDVSQNMDALLSHIRGEAPFTILDVGCGPGRDLKRFTQLGHIAVGLEGASKFAPSPRTSARATTLAGQRLAKDLTFLRTDHSSHLLAL